MAHATMTSKGQITIPRAVRKLLKLKTGDMIDFKISNGTVILTPVSKSVSEVFGVLSRDKQKPVTVDQMNDGLKKAVGRK